LNIYFDAVALEHPEFKIISILPSYVDTPLLHRLQTGSEFDWSEPLKPKEIAELIGELTDDNSRLVTGSRIVVVNEALREDLEYKESLWAYYADRKEMLRLS